MKKMKNSGIDWIGDIPVEWRIGRIKYVIKVLTDFTSNGSFADLAENITYCDYDEYARLVRLTDLRLDLKNDGIFVDESGYEYLSNSKLFGKEILIANVGAYSGLFCEMPIIDKPATLAPNMFLIKTNEKILQHFLYYLGNTSLVHQQLSQKSTSSAQPKLNKVDVKTTYIVMPPLQEQQAISDYLDKKCLEIDSLITDIKAQIDVLEEYKKSVITETVTKGLDKNVQMKDSGVEWIGYVPKHWLVKKIKYIYKFHTGFTPDTTKSDFYSDLNDGHNWITISDLNNKNVAPKTTKSQISSYYVNLFKPLITPKDSLLYTFKLSVGQVAFTTYDVYTNEAIASFINNENVNLNYLYYSSFLIECYANENIYGAKILNQKLINNSTTIFPPLNEQQEIANYLDEKCSCIDETITYKLEQVTTLEEYRKSIIFEYVTGKKEVNENE